VARQHSSVRGFRKKEIGTSLAQQRNIALGCLLKHVPTAAVAS
jgi:hypothetical protein